MYILPANNENILHRETLISHQTFCNYLLLIHQCFEKIHITFSKLFILTCIEMHHFSVNFPSHSPLYDFELCSWV